MTREPRTNVGVFVDRVVVQYHMDDLAGWDVTLQRVEEANELLMPVALHVVPEHLAGKDIQRGEERGGAVALVVMGHGCAAPLLERQARLGAVERLDLGLLVDTKHH